MNPLAVPPLLCAVISFAIGAFVLSKNPRSPLHRSFTLLCITLAYMIALAGGINYFCSVLNLIPFYPLDDCIGLYFMVVQSCLTGNGKGGYILITASFELVR